MKNVTVFGGTGPTGQLIVADALERGHRVVVLARNPDKLVMRHERLTVVKGDVFDANDVAGVVSGRDAIISSLGVPYTFKPVTIYSSGAANIIAAMHAAGIRRFVTITSGGTYPGRAPENPFFFEYVLKPLFHTLYDDMRRMEVLVEQSDLDWTVLRPARLTNKPRSGGVRVAPGQYSLRGFGTTTRRDLARTALDALESGDLLRVAAAVASEPVSRS
jgi:putative NADH-flavin reductase